ncbi:MAG: hypothetical protein ACK4VO_05390 [Pseudobdellovibrio sp.]
MNNDIFALKKLKNPEVTTSMLMSVLNEYKDVRKKISILNKKCLIKSVKQGIYLINPEIGLRPYSKEILANLIYGPSYVSLESALSHYGFIPERVNTTTSVSFNRGRSFLTPVGSFEYHNIKSSIYSVGFTLKEIYNDVYCLYATPEKALLDFTHIKEAKGHFKNQKDYFNYIVDSYRMDLDAINNKISLKKLQIYSELYPFRHTRWFADELTRKLIK